MQELIVRLCCFVANIVLGQPPLVVTAEQEQEIALSRTNDLYFLAFRQRCMLWVYGDDPRRSKDAHDQAV